MEDMTDRQLNFIVSLIIDKLESCKDMDEVKKALDEIKGMLKKEKANEQLARDNRGRWTYSHRPTCYIKHIIE